MVSRAVDFGLFFKGAHDFDNRVLSFAAHDQIDLIFFHRFMGHQGQVRAAENGNRAVFLSRFGRLPGVDNQRRRGRQADDIKRVTGQLLLKGFHILFDRGIPNFALVSVSAQRAGQVAQPHMDVFTTIPDFRFGTG